MRWCESQKVLSCAVAAAVAAAELMLLLLFLFNILCFVVR